LTGFLCPSEFLFQRCESPASQAVLPVDSGPAQPTCEQQGINAAPFRHSLAILRHVRHSSWLANAIVNATDLREREMKAIAVMTVVTVCLAGLAGCGTTKSYSEMYVHGWTRESMEKRFPTGTTERQVVDRLGYPYRASKADRVERWDYAGGKTSKQRISFVFRDGKLVEKMYENF
jgi:hypothetical protein